MVARWDSTLLRPVGRLALPPSFRPHRSTGAPAWMSPCARGVGRQLALSARGLSVTCEFQPARCRYLRRPPLVHSVSSSPCVPSGAAALLSRGHLVVRPRSGVDCDCPARLRYICVLFVPREPALTVAIAVIRPGPSPSLDSTPHDQEAQVAALQDHWRAALATAATCSACAAPALALAARDCCPSRHTCRACLRTFRQGAPGH